VHAGQIEPVSGRPVVQVGILVDDLDRALERYATRFGVGPWRIYTYGPSTLTSMSYRGEPGTFSMLLALAGQSPQLELIQPLEGPSVYHEWLERHGPGLHHVAVEVDSLTQTIATMELAGYPLLQLGRGFGPDGDGGFAYFDTQDDLGVIVEAIEEAKRIAEPERVYP
jgi:catechol 2,3-dioxygenase-like lactoylglutathione lyase family enzyme